MDRATAPGTRVLGRPRGTVGRLHAVDTIFALSSGPPPAGVAVIRISGPGTRFGLATIIDTIPEPRRAALRSLHNGAGEVLDRGLVLFFPGPGSFTGEDAAELQVHGGRAVVAALLAALARIHGFRPAEAGEFTRRAFHNGRMDLTEVEGLADLVAAETEAQRRQALRQATGGLRVLYDGWRERLIRARALIEAELDFSDEEDIPGSVSKGAFDAARAIGAEIVAHLADTRGERLRDGAEVVVLGAPNAGKSSLINAIAKRDVAIVAPEPGTTRDLIEVRLDLQGYPVTLVDTAGLREAEGGVEREGIRRARARAGTADVVLWLRDLTDTAADDAPALAGSGIVIRVGTKLDLLDARTGFAANDFDAVVSSVTGEGVGALLSLLGRRVAALMAPGDSVLMTRERHRRALSDAADAIAAAIESEAAPLELRAEDLRRAGDALGRLTGRIDVEDLLDVIFRDFCIGK